MPPPSPRECRGGCARGKHPAFDPPPGRSGAERRCRSWAGADAWWCARPLLWPVPTPHEGDDDRARRWRWESCRPPRWMSREVPQRRPAERSRPGPGSVGPQTRSPSALPAGPTVVRGPRTLRRRVRHRPRSAARVRASSPVAGRRGKPMPRTSGSASRAARGVSDAATGRLVDGAGELAVGLDAAVVDVAEPQAAVSEVPGGGSGSPRENLRAVCLPFWCTCRSSSGQPTGVRSPSTARPSSLATSWSPPAGRRPWGVTASPPVVTGRARVSRCGDPIGLCSGWSRHGGSVPPVTTRWLLQ